MVILKETRRTFLRRYKKGQNIGKISEMENFVKFWEDMGKRWQNN